MNRHEQGARTQLFGALHGYRGILGIFWANKLYYEPCTFTSPPRLPGDPYSSTHISFRLVEEIT